MGASFIIVAWAVVRHHGYSVSMRSRFVGQDRAVRRAPWALAMLLVLLGRSAPLWAGVPFVLPQGEQALDWQGALLLGGEMALDSSAAVRPDQPWVELERTAVAGRWRLRVWDGAGALHEMEVDEPRSRQAREELVALAASLLHPVAGAGGFWSQAGSQLPAPPERSEASALAAPDEQELPVGQAPPSAAPAQEVVERSATQVSTAQAHPAQAAPATSATAQTPAAGDTAADGAPPNLAQAAAPTAAAPPPLPPPLRPDEPAEPVRARRPTPWVRIEAAVDPGVGGLEPGFGAGADLGLAPVRRVAPEGRRGVWQALVSGLRLGAGLRSETRQQVPLPNWRPQLVLQETDAFGSVWWAGQKRLAGMAAVQLGASIRRFTQEGEEQEPFVEAFLGLDLGFSLDLGASLAIQPISRLQLDLYGTEVWLPDERIVLPKASLHLGLALVLQPEAR